VTNKDECITVKSPSRNLLIQNIHCNISGGCGMGSLGIDTAISNIQYRNVYTWKSNQMMMIKSNGGSGFVADVVFENFIGHENAYAFNIDQYWASMAALEGSGVALSNITATNWRGVQANGAQRGPVKVACADGAPCTDINVANINMWTQTGSKNVDLCRSGHGRGACLKNGDGAYGLVTQTVTSPPTAYAAPTMKEDLSTAWGTANSIPIPTLQASYYPGVLPISKAPGQ
jgi:rhamnogalacturonan hydrolase